MQKFIKPKEGLLVRHPRTFSKLLDEGESVEWKGDAGRFWRRRVKTGDVYIVKHEKKKAVKGISIIGTTLENINQYGSYLESQSFQGM